MKSRRLAPRPLKRSETTTRKARKTKSTLNELDYTEQDRLDALIEAEEHLYALKRKKDTDPLDLLDAQIEVETARTELTEAAELLGDKLLGYAKYIENLTHSKKGVEWQITQFTRRKGGIISTLNYLKDTLMDYLNKHQLSSMPVGEGLKIAKQKSAPSVLIEIPVEELPTEFQNITIEAKKNDLREALAQGEEIDGVRVIRREHIRVRKA